MCTQAKIVWFNITQFPEFFNVITQVKIAKYAIQYG